MKLSITELLLFALLVVAALAPAFANEAKPEGGQALQPCAVVDRFFGDSQILDETRTHITEADHRAPVPCGGWVSVEKGWITLQHRFGYRIHLGVHSFARFMDDGDAVIVYGGQVFAQASGGMGELRILTPNARIRVSRASVVTLFDPDEESTQVTAVDGKVVFENRFDGTKKSRTEVKSGYASSLDFKLMRVVPSVPKIVATSSLRAKLKELNVPASQTERALAIARNRQNELASAFERSQAENVKVTSGKAQTKSTSRVPASEPAHGSAAAADSADSEESALRNSNDYLLRKTLGGSQEGVKILRPSAGKRKNAPRKAQIQVEDPEAQLMAKQKRADDQEQRRLIEELSKIHSD